MTSNDTQSRQEVTCYPKVLSLYKTISISDSFLARKDLSHGLRWPFNLKDGSAWQQSSERSGQDMGPSPSQKATKRETEKSKQNVWPQGCCNAAILYQEIIMNKNEVILILCEVILIDEHQDYKISIQFKIKFSLEFVKRILVLLVFFSVWIFVVFRGFINK